MKQALIAVLSFFFLGISSSEKPSPSLPVPPPVAPLAAVAPSANQLLYDELHLEALGLNRESYSIALRGMEQISAKKQLLSIVDMSQPSSKKRLYIIDLANRKLLFNTYVAHGRNSGELMPNRFSNTNSSFQSSLGFYKTMGLYTGKHGLSMQLQGLEKGINDNAFSRAIVMHGADYVCEDFIRRTGRLGRSQGCPAVSVAECTPIIRAISGGSCLFVYYPDDTYLTKSAYLKS
ncbi:murein L,D-transpeptidase catalytic domain family protein [Fibrella aquatica]|uniref:murein L,D-transpeptidase catalytic domain family protein n=1 Tax=Fibrella aquatica TaxID=3242487 RepID=UPI00351FC2AE